MGLFSKQTNRRTNTHWFIVASLAPWITGSVISDVALCWPALARTQMCQVSSNMSHAHRKMEESKARRIQWLSLFFYAAVVFFLLPCNTWRFMPGARCRELIACHCLCAFVFPSLSTRRQLSKKNPAWQFWDQLSLSASILVHYYSIPI